MKQSGTELYKIGKSIDPFKRLQQLNTSSPKKIYLIDCVSTDAGVETRLHNFYRKYLSNGEWFSLNTNQVYEILEEFSFIRLETRKSFVNFLVNNDHILRPQDETLDVLNKSIKQDLKDQHEILKYQKNINDIPIILPDTLREPATTDTLRVPAATDRLRALPPSDRPRSLVTPDRFKSLPISDKIKASTTIERLRASIPTEIPSEIGNMLRMIEECNNYREIINILGSINDESITRQELINHLNNQGIYSSTGNKRQLLDNLKKKILYDNIDKTNYEELMTLADKYYINTKGRNEKELKKIIKYAELCYIIDIFGHKELRKIAKSLGINDKGTKETLISRIRLFLIIKNYDNYTNEGLVSIARSHEVDDLNLYEYLQSIFRSMNE